VKGLYSKENITEVIILILIEMNIISNLGYLITDNAAVNDIIIKLILQRLRFNITYLKERRGRYLNYIINLAAKAFLFNNNKKSFKNIEINILVSITAFKVEMAF
jgi:hypothetical protein